MGLKRIKNTDTAQAKKNKHTENETVEQRLQAVEKLLGLK